MLTPVQAREIAQLQEYEEMREFEEAELQAALENYSTSMDDEPGEIVPCMILLEPCNPTGFSYQL